MPTGTDVSIGIFSINLDMAYISYMTTNWGMPETTGLYSKICATDYPAQLPIAYDILGDAITGYTWADDIVTMPAAT